MKIITPIIILLVFAGGCNQTLTPTQQLTNLDTAATVLETALIIADQNQSIPIKDRPAIAAAISVLNADLAAANANINSPTITSILAQVQADLTALAALKAKYPSTLITQPSTKPS